MKKNEANHSIVILLINYIFVCFNFKSSI